MNVPADTPSRTTRLLVALGLFLGTVLLFGRTLGNRFIDFDDPGYVTKNPHVEAGLTLDGFKWAWTSYSVSNWHPLTWLSLQLDAQLHGLDHPGGFHLSSVLLHAASAVVLLLALWRMTGALWRSALVAALFAWHPLHVESVAWVAERKDVLSGLFWMLCLWAYALYAERPSLLRYLGVLLLYALGLAAKPMLVTLPCVLLLLDYWPLGRFGTPHLARSSRHDRNAALADQLKLAILEKVPMLGLSVFSSVLTWQAQSSGKAVMNLEHLSLRARALNALASYFVYLEKTVWPSDLTVFYALNRELSTPWAFAGAVCALAAATLAAVLMRRRAPYVLVGWLWYVGTLVPVIGLVQVGSQARADRYTYIPLIGIFLVVSWGLADLAQYFHRRLAGIAVAAAALAGCVVLTWIQIGFWHDSVRLWQHALEVDPENPVAHINLAAEMGKKLAGKGRVDPEDMPLVQQLEAHYQAVLKVLPNNCKARYDLGVLSLQQENYPEALFHLEKAWPGSPDDPQINNSLGLALMKVDRAGDAEPYLRRAIKSDRRHFRAHFNLGRVLEAKGRFDEAAEEYQEALRLRPDHGSAAQGIERIAWKWAAVGAAAARKGDFDLAVSATRRALQLARDRGHVEELRQRLESYRRHQPWQDVEPQPLR